ncbi:CDGSH iron-sulfur domain-containing protein [Lysobacter sp. S4-A87]|uniref:ferritin-like domain-containing protein n=1 Tax=Lysobacter sp. S4-A87 TaxID=2925843 RepID=UPI001F5366F9|nr:ferritin-like domain-containing protein [Lysobacter sp. S4-A87]UNK49894.1 CDGSH iron-sulfur domain-containing protein [Lysobacter sp. S4-A87]
MDQQIAVPTSREQLWALLAEAAEIEHHLMCCYLYAAFSLKERTDEDLSEVELGAVERWRREILAVSVEEMGHLTIVCNILSALGAPAHLVHQNFPIPPGYHPAGVVVKLAPFNRQTLAHFVYLERPDDTDVQDGEGFEPPQHYSRALGMDRLMTACTDYETVGELYRSVSAGLQRLSESMGERRLFVGNPDHQLDADGARLPALKTVRCLKTALEAIDAIVRQGEGADSCTGDSHYQRFLRIGREYDALLASRPAFRPARMSAHNPVMRPPPTPEGRLWISAEPAAALLDLGNALYNHCLRCVSLAYGDVGREAQAALVSAGVDLMHLLTPVATRLGTLPANPSLPQATAGLSFATIRSSAALMGEAGSVDILVERLREIGERCERLMDLHPQEAALLGATRTGTERLAHRLSAQAERCRREEATMLAQADTLQDSVVRSLQASQAPPPERLETGAELIPGSAVDIVYHGARCIHARHCVLGLPGVFRANTPGAWIHPDAATTEALVTVAHMCPSGAIAYRRHDGGAEEAPPPVNLVQLRENGPLGVRARIVLDGVPVGMRAVLCRCGASQQKPFCDGSHNEIHFQATGEPASVESKPLQLRDGPLNIDPEVNGPLVVSGNLEICCGTGRTIDRVTSTRLCRCGGSSNKPFCDDTHRRNGFRS